MTMVAIGNIVGYNLWELLLYTVAGKALGSAVLDWPGEELHEFTYCPPKASLTNDNSVILIPYPLSDTKWSEMPKVIFHSICPQLCFVLGDNGFGEKTHLIDGHGVEHFNKVIIQQAKRHVVSASYNSRIHELVREEAKARGL